MNEAEFEKILTRACQSLRKACRNSADFHDPNAFEDKVRQVLARLFKDESIGVADSSHPHAFPDIAINGFGVEVKSTKSDSWRATANSIMETMREESVRRVYVIFGKMGGLPDVRWRRYEDSVYHVRISHAPRFCVEMEGSEEPLFKKLGVAYEEFAVKEPEEKMNYVGRDVRERMKPGDKIWWLEQQQESLPLEVKRYSALTPAEKIITRAEAAVLCPRVVSRGSPNKYDNVAHFLITRRGILWSRDMFSAGSVGDKEGKGGGKHKQNQFADIEHAMIDAFGYLEHELFCEYWKRDDIPQTALARLMLWLTIADGEAGDHWKPSDKLFKEIRNG